MNEQVVVEFKVARSPMTNHVEALLEDYVLGTLGSADVERVALHLCDCADCRASAEALESDVETVAAAMPPPQAGLLRLERALAGAGRFEHFSSALQRLFDLPAERIAELLSRIDDVASWNEGLADGVKVMPVEAGPSRAGFMTALVYVDAGAVFPEHEHGAEEQVLVLEGGYLDSLSGLEVWRGELDVRAAGTSHSFTALPGGRCLCASVSRPPDS